jgi:hypothetical protein
MAEALQGVGSLCLKPLNYPQTVRNWSNEDLVDLIKRVLKTDVNLDFLLELNPKDFEILVACIRARIDCWQKS